MARYYSMPKRGQRRVRLLDGSVLEAVDWRVSREKRKVWVRVLKDPMGGSLLAIGYDRGCAPIYEAGRSGLLVVTGLVYPAFPADVELEESHTVEWVMSTYGEPPPWLNERSTPYPFNRPARSSINEADQKASGGFIRGLPRDTASPSGHVI